MKTQSKTPLTAVEPQNAGTHKKYGKWRGIRSCLSVFLAAVVTVTTIHSQVLFVQAENGGETDNKTRFAFLESSYQKEFHLGKKGPLNETLAQLPTSLPVNMEKTEDKTDPGETVPDVSDGNPTEDAGQKESDQDTAENIDSENAAASAENNGENTSGDAADGESEESTPGDTVHNENSESTSDDTAGGENGGDASGDAAALPDASLQTTVPDAPVYSAPGELSAAVITASGNDPSGTPGNSDPESGSEENSPVLSMEPAPEEDSAPQDAATDDAKDTALQTAETDVSQKAAPPTDETTGQELPVSWSCDHYDDMRDSYVFTATWNKSLFECTGGEVPTITVTFEETPFLVSSEEELRQAFITLFENPPKDETPVSIVLTDNIPLSDTLYIPTDWPKNIQITLESKMDESSTGFSLTRGKTSSGTTFSGAMLLFGNYPAQDADVPAPASANSAPAGALTLTLRNITIDGKMIGDIGADSSILSTDVNKADAPAVISSGHLILESEARIVNNYNGGTYLLDETNAPVPDENGGNQYAIPPCGGGLWVRGGTLELRKGCRIQYNTAEQFGGGIYLSSGAVLRCYTEAEALTGNTSATGGAGADLYACAGSTIYYDPTVFIPWSSFYLDEAKLIPEGGSAPDTTTPVEIYLHVCSDSGYSYQEVKEQLENAFGSRVTVLMPQSYMIDTTDLRNWYVYDHYDTNCWDGASIDSKPVDWQNAYKEYKHRPYYGYTTRHARTTVKDDEISAWLENPPYELENKIKYLALAPLKEHIYSTAKNGRPEMSFVGYDEDPNVDFLFYDPESPGQKTVEFDVDSSKVNIHTLAGTGFLLNTGIVDKDFLSGYLLYYTYSGTSASTVSLYKFEKINIDSLHSSQSNGISQIVPTASSGQTTGSSNLIGSTQNITAWDTEMSIKIKVEADKITLTQHPKNKPATADNTFTHTWAITSDPDLNGFGPLVAYQSHACYKASSFTYSNLRMQFTNPDDEKNLLSSLAEADFTQGGNVKRYFMNLLGNSQTLSYGGNSTGTQLGGQYLEYLYMMQDEGIGLITDAETGFKEYLGPTKISANLFEIPNPDKSADLNRLIANLKTYLSMYPTTELPENLTDTDLTPAKANKPVGNIYLTGADNVQLKRVINANTIASGYIVNVMDNACNPLGEDYTAEYSLRKPGSSEYLKLPLGSGTEDPENPAALFSAPGRTDGVSFVITNDPIAWPAGLYTVKQEITGKDSGASSIHGYSYFTLTRDALPVEVPDRIVSSSGSSQENQEITVPSATQNILLSDGASQPKTGDGMFPAMPVACGACTAFMLKIMLWMYDMDFEAITELKLDTVQALISWGKGAAKPRIYLAIAALTVVITAYHIVKALYESSRQFVRERLGKA